ncbi:hypothetical protein ALC53_12559 [Atta colombica]|uniref:Uncharacterized protein n=1 Tax=Atta colombica TaxID=520822 RepID=A0A195AXP1_9HYME|nr:hypothetical protein ALC53_12559 [Atta colombica]
MPVRRGHVAPRTTIIETIIRKFDTHDTNRLMFLWGYVERCSSLLYDVYDLFISTTTYR